MSIPGNLLTTAMAVMPHTDAERALEVPNIGDAWRDADKAGLNPTTVKKHPWDALAFYLFDPERHRVEIWQAVEKKES